MKEKLKYFLLGACSVVGGFLLYAWTRDASKSSRVTGAGGVSKAAETAASPSASGVYIAHRRKQIRRQRGAQACDAIRPETTDAPLSDHTMQNTGTEENNQ